MINAFKKIAGIKTEIFGSIPSNPLTLGASIVGAGVGLHKGKHTKEEQAKAEDKTWSNVLVPGLGAYRLARRR